MTTEAISHLLDVPVRASLTGEHARFAVRRGRVLRYEPGLATFAALPDAPDAQDWHDAALLAGPGQVLYLVGQDLQLPPGWTEVSHAQGVQLVADHPVVRYDEQVRVLGFDDAPEILALVEATKPGPFLPRSLRYAQYFGFRAHGQLVAVAGLRMRPAGFAEVSTVCTLPEHRGRGLAQRLVKHLCRLVVRQGATPFLHAKADQEAVLRLYGALGFEHRTRLSFREIAAPRETSA
ncbi:GNAT family N-acetyltransferase [Streptomyces justiciae]|uniref:GNAT family N-acetyltransferase n=1 Tax=Streptomyces justiciae TaxID=2780140 RepID=UPI00187E9E4A|nr:GNAT family N-acetyltransferase [Streptomyces justiciae]MBE8478381.1 GNAT family N-acetyltransferase [Streptomyces justiciae]